MQGYLQKGEKQRKPKKSQTSWRSAHGHFSLVKIIVNSAYTKKERKMGPHIQAPQVDKNLQFGSILTVNGHWPMIAYQILAMS